MAMVVAVAIGGTAVTAAASTSAPAVTCAWTAPQGPAYYILSKGGTADYWLSYDTCDGNVRGAMTQNSKNNEWHLWVFNETTGATVTKWVTAVNENQYTAPITASGDYSHVCVQPYTKSGVLTGNKVCTAYYKAA
jgi:hypothetical protein